jgi:membrane protease YdiL (CAAX protease family)
MEMAEENTKRIPLVLLLCILFLTSVLVYTLAGYNYFLSRDIKFIIKVCAPIGLLGVVLLLRRKKEGKDFEKIYQAFFMVALGFLMAWLFGGWYDLVPGYDGDSLAGWTIAKVAEVLPIVLTILILNPLFHNNMESLYLRKGKIGKSILMGLLICPLSLLQFAAQGGFGLTVGFDVIIGWLPLLLLFSLSNGFMEELIFRGLFLKKYERIMGSKKALIFISMVFAGFHGILLPYMGWEMVIIFVVFLFFVSWLWGLSVQKTNSLWGAVIAHAFADILLLLAVFGI